MLPHEIERLGPELTFWLEKCLLHDLSHYSVVGPDLWIDWSNVTQEGHWTEYNNRMLESLSDIVVRDSDGNLVAEGWMDFVIVTDDADAQPLVFWLFLSVVSDGTFSEVKSDAFLPSHVWEALIDEHKTYVASTDSKWIQRDPKVQKWRRSRNI